MVKAGTSDSYSLLFIPVLCHNPALPSFPPNGGGVEQVEQVYQ